MDLGTNKFRRRFRWALTGSLALHLIVLCAVTLRACQVEDAAAPLVITLLPAAPPAPEPPPAAEPPPEGPRNLVDAVNPSPEPPAPTPNVAEQDSRAQDLSDAAGAPDRPHVEQEAEQDTPPAAPHPPAPAVAPAPETAKPKKSEKEKKKDTKEQKEAAPSAAPPDINVAAPPDTGEPESPPSDTPQAAQPLPESERARDARGRVGGGVTNMGFLGYEALRSEVAPYLKEVRKRVERNWYAALQMRYQGTTPTRAVVECAIAADGRLIHATILEPGESATYAPLCREAIERAGPFPPFPFEVPHMYRDKNLVIRWTFDFLR